ncbi:MAG: SIR2 family protein [Isosphaeraceae bacterium]|nr:SIR2 family protein [Isosphaeraceae bacterium]
MPAARTRRPDGDGKTNLPQTLIERLQAKKIIPFVGAGVSRAVKRATDGQSLFPSWKEFLLEAAKLLGKEQRENHANLVTSHIGLGGSERFLLAAKEAREGLGPVWPSFLKRQFGHSRSEVADESLELARLVWKLGSNLVITTNYDYVLRWACPCADDCDLWNIESTANQADLVREGAQRPVIWHLHGHVGDVANIILTPDGYSCLYSQNDQSETRYKAALATLQHQLVSHSFLFVGFSLNDAHVSAQLRQVEQIYNNAHGPHYVLLSEAETNRMDKEKNPGIEVIPFAEHGDPLLEKLRVMIAVVSRGRPASEGKTAADVESRTHRGRKPLRPARQKGSSPAVKREPFEQERDSQKKRVDANGGHGFEGAEKARHAIKAILDLLADRRMRDDKGNEVGIRERIAEELELPTSPAGELSERIAAFLTGDGNYRNLAKLLRVFQQLWNQKKYEDARRINDVMKHVLPLCLPYDDMVNVSRQLIQDKEVFLHSHVRRPAGAELFVARLFHQEADFVPRGTSEPRGTMLAAYFQDVPIGDPDAAEAAMLRELFVATHFAEAKLDEHGNLEPTLSIDEIKPKLNGYFEAEADVKKRPWYCMVQLPRSESDVQNLARFLRGLGLPNLLFIGIAAKSDPVTTHIEEYIITILNTIRANKDERTPQ